MEKTKKDRIRVNKDTRKALESVLLKNLWNPWGVEWKDNLRKWRSLGELVFLKNLWNPDREQGEQGHLPWRVSTSKICEIQGENSTISVNSPQQASKQQLESISVRISEKSLATIFVTIRRGDFIQKPPQREINLSKEKIWQQSWQFEEVTQHGRGHINRCLFRPIEFEGQQESS